MSPMGSYGEGGRHIWRGERGLRSLVGGSRVGGLAWGATGGAVVTHRGTRWVMWGGGGVTWGGGGCIVVVGVSRGGCHAWGGRTGSAAEGTEEEESSGGSSVGRHCPRGTRVGVGGGEGRSHLLRMWGGQLRSDGPPRGGGGGGEGGWAPQPYSCPIAESCPISAPGIAPLATHLPHNCPPSTIIAPLSVPAALKRPHSPTSAP